MSSEYPTLNCLKASSYGANATFASLHLPITTLTSDYVIFLIRYPFSWIDNPLFKAALALD